MWYPQFKYTFESTDTNFINALIKYYSKMKIKSLQMNDDFINIDKMENLKEIIEGTTKSTITIITEKTPACLTAWYALPKFIPNQAYLDNSTNDRVKFKDDLDAMLSLLGKSDYMKIPPTELKVVNKELDVWKILNLLFDKIVRPEEKDNVIFNVVHSQSDKVFLLYTTSHAYSISYGNKSNVIQAIAPYPAFDLDDGFVNSFVTEEMTDAFINWKNKGMVGELFEKMDTNIMELNDSLPRVSGLSVFFEPNHINSILPGGCCIIDDEYEIHRKEV